MIYWVSLRYHTSASDVLVSFRIQPKRRTMPHAFPARILFIDAYDSFTNNIISLLETRLHVEVTVIKIDDHIDDFATFLKPFAAVAAGPGPGDPRNLKDVGLFRELWQLDEHDVLPVLGICLGFQSLVHAFGGTIQRLPEPRHGVLRNVASHGEAIFDGVNRVETVQYHSLHACLGYDRNAEYEDLWKPSSACPDLMPLAWDFDFDNIEVGDVTSETSFGTPGRVLMAVQHVSKPFYGLQFHAESICSEQNAQKIIDTWWATARRWNKGSDNVHPAPNLKHLETFEKACLQDENPKASAQSRLLEQRTIHDDLQMALQPTNGRIDGRRLESNCRKDFAKGHNPITNASCIYQKHKIEVSTRVVGSRGWAIPRICEVLGLTKGNSIILDSENHIKDDVGAHSIIGIIRPESLRFEYNVGTFTARTSCNGQTSNMDLAQYEGGIFAYLKSFMRQYRVNCPHMEIPFWGGLMGYISYEACMETIGIEPEHNIGPRNASQRPDLGFVFVERSIVLEHLHGKMYIQTIRPNDDDWLEKTTSLLSKRAWDLLPRTSYEHLYYSSSPTPIPAQISLPDETTYKSQVRACQDSIRAGNSYELCLTTQATIKTASRQESWSLYCRLRDLNPSPFSAYVRLGQLTLLSSSPERFLSWSRPKRTEANRTWHNGEWSDKASICQFRPIKGTVKKRTSPDQLSLTVAEATKLLSTRKERAENLMIVDLIRHDLHGVVGSGNVTVPKLMVVEEYATLFQLVSVIEGNLVINDSDDEEDVEDDAVVSETASDHSTGSSSSTTDSASPEPDAEPTTSGKRHSKTGIDVLASSLPPGSMTGAPKIRSCQLLRQLENRQRGIYSGVVGYMDVGGGGDFSVVIRSVVRWDRENADDDGALEKGRGVGGKANGEGEGDEWTIGAGGAVTSLSTEDGEWEEMQAKLRSTLRLFQTEEGK